MSTPRLRLAHRADGAQVLLASAAQPDRFEAPEQTQSAGGGEWLVVEAYVLVWLLLFALLALSMVRLRRLEGRIDQLESELKRAAEPDSTKENPP